MKKFVQIKLIILFICLSVFHSSLYADAKFDPCNYEKETLSSLICYGPSILTDTTISGDMKVSGSLTAKNISVGAMDIVGNVVIKKSKVNGDAEVKGAFHAYDVDFMKDIQVTSSDIILSHSRIRGSVSIHAANANEKPILHAQCGTIVAGSVNFEDTAGIVEIAGSSAIQGKIINGSIEFVDLDCSSPE